MIASFVFYGWWSKIFLGLLIGCTLLNYLLVFKIQSENSFQSKWYLRIAVVLNLSILGIFKYYNFFIEQFQLAFLQFGIQTHITTLKWALPVGISFYTFHGLSYVFDVYRKLQKPVLNFIDYAVFVSFFPLLVAGPIERANHLLPQIQKPRTFNYKQSVNGLRLILWGMVKKVVIADTLATIVTSVYNEYANQDAYVLILAAIAFSFQIYGDFSGYSDIALGTAKLFGFELLSNFKVPYFSRDIAEFWRRWHISLSSWFRDYLYIPLGGSKINKLVSVRNTFIIFLVSGFWHGASWNFITWGFIHALGFLPLLLLNRNRKNTSSVVAENSWYPSIKELFQMVATFLFVTFAWIFFRAKTLTIALQFIKRIFKNSIENPQQFLHLPGGVNNSLDIQTIVYYIIPMVFFDWLFRRNEREIFTNFKSEVLRWIIYFVMGLFVMFYFGTKSSFIYFQF